ncbi:MAG: hypothetical protein QOE92_1487 [Chloroflexota bacterium]|jgi:Mn2+/Fe2+ NRAMP family transporter|nr:hypothetical protein [Chloroflexota bacterium]
MKRVLAVALGILTAIGGFVDVGELVFNSQAGARFGYNLIWVILVGMVGIMVYSEMCGRVAAVSARPVFDLVRERLSFTPGLVTLVAAQFVNLLTLVAEVGGAALVLELVLGPSYRWMGFPVAAVLALLVWFLPYDVLERAFAYFGLGLMVFVAGAVALHPDWMTAAKGMVPQVDSASPALYCYFIVGILGATMTPYEMYFYSSGGVEERWTPADMTDNRLNTFIGYPLGALIGIAIMVMAAEVFLPREVQPQFLATSVLGPAVAFGLVGVALALVGMFFAMAGAAFEVALSGAYSMAQFFGWQWGRLKRPGQTPRFTVAWVVMLLAAGLVVATGIDPVQVTEYSIIFATVALPLTYLPVLLVANDRQFMGGHANRWLANSFGVAYMVIISVVAVAAIPLMIVTKAGTSG